MPTLLTRTSSPSSAAAASETTRPGSAGCARSAATWAVSPIAGRLAPPAGDDARSFRDEKAHSLQPDPSGRAGHEAPLFAQSEVHERG